MKTERLIMKDELNYSNGVAVKQGEHMLGLIRAGLERIDRVEVSFAGTEGASTAFVNALAPPLYLEADAEEVDPRIDNFHNYAHRHAGQQRVARCQRPYRCRTRTTLLSP